MQSDAPPATTHSHTFEVDTDNVCLNCHLSDPGHSAIWRLRQCFPGD